MKYIVGINRTNPKKLDINNSPIIYPFNIINGTYKNAVNTMVETITVLKFFGKLFVISNSFLLRKALFTWITLLHLARIYGTAVRDNISGIKTNTPISKVFARNSVRERLIIVPNQNIRFQKLSRFSLDLTQFILLIRLLHNYYVIITGFRYLMQIKTVIYSWNFAFYYWLVTKINVNKESISNAK